MCGKLPIQLNGIDLNCLPIDYNWSNDNVVLFFFIRLLLVFKSVLILCPLTMMMVMTVMVMLRETDNCR